MVGVVVVAFFAPLEYHFIQDRLLLSNFNNDINLLDSLDYICMVHRTVNHILYAGKKRTRMTWKIGANAWIEFAMVQIE